MPVERKDVWASGNAYEPYVGRWSRLVAREFLNWLGAPANGEWLDVGCGTGALCEVRLQTASPRRVTGVDPSEGFVSFGRSKVTDQRATFQVGDTQALPVPDGSFDAMVAGLLINFVPEQAKAAGEMRRVTRPGGIVAGYVWDYAGEMQLMRRFWDAAIALDPAAIPVTKTQHRGAPCMKTI
jgi:ubiquinone/menaquinone biosynthesis C-methylase UbiE